MQIRAEFESNKYEFPVRLGLIRLNEARDVTNPRALAEILQKAEEYLAERRHPDPYIRMFSLVFVCCVLILITSSERPWRNNMVGIFFFNIFSACH